MSSEREATRKRRDSTEKGGECTRKGGKEGQFPPYLHDLPPELCEGGTSGLFPLLEVVSLALEVAKLLSENKAPELLAVLILTH